MDDDAKIRGRKDWRERGFNKHLAREREEGPKQADYIGGADFDSLLDELMFNRVLMLKDLRKTPQGNEPGKIYWDGDNKKYKIWVDSTGKWADVQYTSTSTTTSTTSSSSTSTS